MELDILHFHCLASGCSASRLKHDFVVEAQSQLWHAGQIAFHFDSTENLGAEDIAVGGNKEIKRFDDIKENFVLAVAYTFASPADSIGDGDGRSCDFEFV